MRRQRSGLITREGSLANLALLQVANEAAVLNLDRWASKRGRSRYVAKGDRLNLDVLAGVTIDVLGPPSWGEDEHLKKARRDHPEYWMALGSPSQIQEVSSRVRGLAETTRTKVLAGD
jgi:hypothetical protein